MTKPLGRLIRYDVRSKSFPLKESIDNTKLRSYTWRCKKILDQGLDGACVGFSWAHELCARPNEMYGVNYDRAILYYYMSQMEDPWEGGAYLSKDNENFYEGSSVLGGAKALHKAGIIKGYKWCFNLEDILLALSWHGPIIMGTLWYSDMFKPVDGFLNPTGDLSGGHAWLLNSISLKDETVGMVNSWGPEWGNNGTAKLTFKNVEKLLLNQGEACAPIDFYIR